MYTDHIYTSSTQLTHTYTNTHTSFKNHAGYLSSGDSNAPGNYALLDMTAGLHWVKENIAAFGGDPERVCLFGYKFGASLVNMLLISPISSSTLCGGSNKILNLFCLINLLLIVWAWSLD